MYWVSSVVTGVWYIYGIVHQKVMVNFISSDLSFVLDHETFEHSEFFLNIMEESKTTLANPHP